VKLIGTGHDRSYFSSIAKRPMAGFLNTGIASEVKAFTVVKNKIRKTVDMQIHTHQHTHTHARTQTHANAFLQSTICILQKIMLLVNSRERNKLRLNPATFTAKHS